jgi:8-oxo-dGTP diphosphatase
MTEDVVGKTMVAGFMFHGDAVLLVQKQHPKWQKGLWNGIGGAVCDGEKPLSAMTREFYEETRQLTLPGDWTHFCTEFEPFGAVVHFFWSRLSSKIPHFETPGRNDVGEILAWHHGVVDMDVLGNLHWLIPLALDWRGTSSPVVVRSVGDIRERATW